MPTAAEMTPRAPYSTDERYTDTMPVPDMSRFIANPLPARPAPTLPAVVGKLKQIEAELNAALVGREDVARAALVAVVAREHLVMLGPPGAAKSLLVREITRRVATDAAAGVPLFEILMTRYTTPEEVYGGINVAALKAGAYERVTAGHLPVARFAFLDEVFKASSAILNSLLTIINERLYRNGATVAPVPLLSVFAASNELPQGDDLAALWDRFLFRAVVNYADAPGFARMLRMAPSVVAVTTLDEDELALAQSAAAALPVPDILLGLIERLRAGLMDAGITVSDRRWRQSLGALRAHALIAGRTVVDEDDLAILEHTLWALPDQRKPIAKAIASAISPTNAKAIELLDMAHSAFNAALEKIAEASTSDSDKDTARIEALRKLNGALAELGTMIANVRANGASTTKLEATYAEIGAWKTNLIESVGI